MTQIAIVGMDGRFPQAPDLDALWKLLLAGADGIAEVPDDRWPVADFYDAQGGPGTSNTRNAGFLSDADAFDHEFFGIAPSEAAAMDPQQRLLLQAAWRALEDATIDPRAAAGSNTGVYVGLMASEWSSVHLSDFARITAQYGSGAGYFMSANRLSYHLDLKGPSVAVDTACSSSLVAAQQACAALRAGACDQALAGGVNLILTPALNIFYTQAGLSAPDGRCKPFSAHADGIGRGEGKYRGALHHFARAFDAVAHPRPAGAVVFAKLAQQRGTLLVRQRPDIGPSHRGGRNRYPRTDVELNAECETIPALTDIDHAETIAGADRHRHLPLAGRPVTFEVQLIGVL